MSPLEKYSVREIVGELNLSTIVENGIRDNFGDPISINELKQISRHRFLSIKNFGYKRWREFQNALAMFDPSDRSVSLINWTSSNTVVNKMLSGIMEFHHVRASQNLAIPNEIYRLQTQVRTCVTSLLGAFHEVIRLSTRLLM